MQFTQSYGLRKEALQLMIKLESKAGNQSLADKYQNQLAEKS